jgi:hypothetical protein
MPLFTRHCAPSSIAPHGEITTVKEPCCGSPGHPGTHQAALLPEQQCGDTRPGTRWCRKIFGHAGPCAPGLPGERPLDAAAEIRRLRGPLPGDDIKNGRELGELRALLEGAARGMEESAEDLRAASLALSRLFP